MTLKSRLRAILDRPRSGESQAEIQARIRSIVENGQHTCPRCGFNRFSGGVHPHAGINGIDKDSTTFCNGRATIPAKNRRNDEESDESF
jgi:hypothetical protein